MPDLPTLEQECFFITPIGDDGSETRKRSDGVFKYIVDRAANEVGLTAVRADQISDPGQINLQVVDHVLGAKAAVADMTGLNPNVFYEIAIRHTARLPLVLIAEKECQLPFDIANMRTIFFDHKDLESADMCREAIVAGLRNLESNAEVDSPIATSIDLRTMSAGNVVERGIADILSTLEESAKMQRTILDINRRNSQPGPSPQAALDAINALDQLDLIARNLEVDELTAAVRELAGPIQHIARRAGIARDSLFASGHPNLQRRRSETKDSMRTLVDILQEDQERISSTRRKGPLKP